MAQREEFLAQNHLVRVHHEAMEGRQGKHSQQENQVDDRHHLEKREAKRARATPQLRLRGAPYGGKRGQEPFAWCFPARIAEPRRTRITPSHTADDRVLPEEQRILTPFFPLKT
jgi:hypothetical protein